MSAATSCQQCGAKLSGDGPGGSCPSCLMALAVGEDGGWRSAAKPAAGRRSVRFFGDYELFEEIARGGMGVVYRARQVSLNRTVALKMILTGQLATPASLQRFHVEAEAAARLEHSHIVPIYEIGVHQGQHFYSMKLIHGGTLADGRFRPEVGGRSSLERIARLMAKVARAVQFAHQRGILHRDLKPTNILLDDEGEPHVADFGLAKLEEDESSLTVSAAVLGTPAYMAPEQAAGAPKSLTTAADVYSLGAILYELAAGRPPFCAGTAIETMRRVCDDPPPSLRRLNPDVDRDLETICLKCLCKRPEERYASAAMLAEDLECWLRKEPITARPQSALQRFWSWRRREPALVGSLMATAALLLVVAVGSPIAAYQINRERLRAKAAQKEEAELRVLAQTRERIAKAQLMCNEGRFEEARSLMQAIGVPALQSERIDAASVYAAITETNARRGRWQDAIPDAIRAVECDPASDLHHASLMTLLAAVNDVERYRRYRRQVLVQFANVDDPIYIGERFAKVCLLRPASSEEMTVLEQWAQQSVQRVTGGQHEFVPYHQFAMALVEYRLGRFESAADWARKSIANPFYGAGHSRYVQASMVLAMSLFRSDLREEALEAFSQGIALEQAQLPDLDGNDLGPGWYWRDWIVAHQLMNEATALIKG